MKLRIDISHHRHSGRLLPHIHTSYAGLFFIALVTAVWMGVITVNVHADPPAYVIPPPSTASFGIGATVDAPPPKTPPVIKAPSSGQTINSLPATVQGSCPKDMLIKIFKNDVLSGAAICDASSSFSVPIDLLVGANTLTAQAFNALDKGGPKSAAVLVTYAPSGPTGFSVAPAGTYKPDITPANQLVMTTDVFYRGFTPGETVGYNVSIHGGTAPYAVSIGWGDGKTDIKSVGRDGGFDITHVYDKAGKGYHGSLPVVLKAVDAKGNPAYLQVVAVVNNVTPVSAASSAVGGNLNIAWPLLILLILIIISFFLGERHEKTILHKKGYI